MHGPAQNCNGGREGGWCPKIATVVPSQTRLPGVPLGAITVGCLSSSSCCRCILLLLMEWSFAGGAVQVSQFQTRRPAAAELAEPPPVRRREGGCRWPTLPTTPVSCRRRSLHPGLPPSPHHQLVSKTKHPSKEYMGLKKKVSRVWDNRERERTVELCSKQWRLRLWKDKLTCESRGSSRSSYISGTVRHPPTRSKLRAVTEWQISRAVAESQPTAEDDTNHRSTKTNKLRRKKLEKGFKK